MPSIRFLLFIACLQTDLYAQNLVPNPSFEVYTECPSNFLLGEPLQAIPWSSGNSLSPDYYNACCDGCSVDVPDNLGGFQEAHTGNAHAGLYCRVVVDRREYITAPLLSPLVDGTTYYVEFYVSPLEFACTTKPIGALFTVGPPVYISEEVLDDYTPQIQVNGDFIDDYEGWTLVSGCFVANGGEDQITIGNFLNDAQTPVNPNCHPETISFDRSYYLIDDVLVEAIPTEELDLDLGEPVTSCDFFIIDPGIPDVVYHWENGSGESSLTVTESGVYSLTISQGCNTGVDSIEVIIPVNVDVELPDEEVNLCSPAVYQIDLDPEAGVYSWSNGNIGSSITISASGIYEVSLDNGCSISTDAVEVIIQDAPEPFTLGEDFILCPDEEVTYTFDPEIGDYTWQNGQHSSTYTILQEGTYSLTITNECGTQTDEVEVTSLEIPQVELGDPVQYICDGIPILFSLDPDAGDYLWQDDTEDPDYQINIAGQYYVFVTKECGEAFDDILVEDLLTPDPDLGPDQLICEGDTITLSVNNQTGLFVWQDMSYEPVRLVTQAGNYSVTVTNACGIGYDSINVGFFPPLDVPDLGKDISLCPGESIVLRPGIGNAAYIWQDLSIADTLFVNTPGSYSVTVSDQCTAYADTVNVILQNEPPDVDLPDGITLCQGSSVTLDAGIIGVNYLWNDGSASDKLWVNSPGIYRLTVSNACGIDTDTVVVIDGGPLPEVSIGDDLSFCPGETVLVTAVGQHIAHLVWNDGSTGQSLTVSETGIISIEAFNTCGVATDTVDATLLPVTPTFDIGADTSICSGDVIIAQPDISGLNLLWSDGSEGEFIVIEVPGIYYATLSGDCGISSDTINIGSLAASPVLDLGPDRFLCPGDVIILHPEVPEVSYLWNDGSTNDTLNITQPGEVMLTVSNICGQANDTLLIIENMDSPKLDLGPDLLACEGDTIILSAGITEVEFLWQDGSTDSALAVTSSGQFSLYVSNSCGEDRDTVNVDINGSIPLPALGPDTVLCEGEKLTLISNAPPGTDLLWQDQSSQSQFVVSQPGIYILQERNHCGKGIDSVFINYHKAPETFDLGRDTVICPGETLLLTVPVTSDDILWQDGSSEYSFIAVAADVYSVIITNECGTRMDEIVVAVDNNELVLDLDDAYLLCPGESIIIDATQDLNVDYLWNTGSTESFLSIIEPGDYAVTVISPCHQLIGRVKVLPGDDCSMKEVFIPNVFSPNNDAINDVFEISHHPDLDIVSMHGFIYDRWGNLLFESQGERFSWNGMREAQPVMQGVYVYQLKWVYLNNGVEHSESRVGDVTVVR